MHIIIDTNFIVTSIKNKIHLFDILKKEFPGDKVLVPLEAIQELELLKTKKDLSLKEREYASLAIVMIKKSNPSIVPLATPNVDAGIIRYCKQHKKVIVATLDRILKEKIKLLKQEVKFLTIKEKKRIVVQ